MTDEQLDFLDDSLRRLKTQYDLYFVGVRRVPPMTERGRIDSLIHEMSRERVRELSKRFRFNTIIARYNKYRELWLRLGREREEGPSDYRRRLREMQQADKKIAERLHHEPTPVVTSPAADSYVRVTGSGDSASVARLHAEIIEAQRTLGKNGMPSIEQVGAMVGKQLETLRSRYGGETFGFRVQIVDGKVKLKAKPLRDSSE